MNKKDGLALALFVLATLFVAIAIDVAVAISFGGALLLAVAALVAAVVGSALNDRLNERAVEARNTNVAKTPVAEPVEVAPPLVDNAKIV